VWGLVE